MNNERILRQYKQGTLTLSEAMNAISDIVETDQNEKHSIS